MLKVYTGEVEVDDIEKLTEDFVCEFCVFPETYKSARMQLEKIKQVIRDYNTSNKNVLIVTHSDYIMDRINSFIRLSNCEEEFIKDLDLEGCVIEPYDIELFYKDVDGVFHQYEHNSTGFFDTYHMEVNENYYGEFSAIVDDSYRRNGYNHRCNKHLCTKCKLNNNEDV